MDNEGDGITNCNGPLGTVAKKIDKKDVRRCKQEDECRPFKQYYY